MHEWIRVLRRSSTGGALFLINELPFGRSSHTTDQRCNWNSSHSRPHVAAAGAGGRQSTTSCPLRSLHPIFKSRSRHDQFSTPHDLAAVNEADGPSELEGVSEVESCGSVLVVGEGGVVDWRENSMIQCGEVREREFEFVILS